MVKLGGQGKAICFNCSMTTITYKTRNVPFSHLEGEYVPDLLVGVCDTCDAVVALPAQATVAIRAKLDAIKARQDKMLAPFAEHYTNGSSTKY